MFCKGRHAAAREAYTEAIALDATVSTFYSNRALCAKALGDWAAVEVDAQKALETDTSLVDQQIQLNDQTGARHPKTFRCTALHAALLLQSLLSTSM